LPEQNEVFKMSSTCSQEKTSDKIIELIKSEGGCFSKELGINLKSKRKEALFKWFIASLLFGARINQEIAKRTYRQLIRAKLTSPTAILNAGWSRIIPLLGAGGYARYDNRTTNKLLQASQKLIEEYDGSLLKMIKNAKTLNELKKQLQSFKGIGETTVEIFLRELRDIFEIINPPLSRLAFQAAKSLSFTHAKNREQALSELKEEWSKTNLTSHDFADFEAALVRYALKHRSTLLK
jgi:endonuclease III